MNFKNVDQFHLRFGSFVSVCLILQLLSLKGLAQSHSPDNSDKASFQVTPKAPEAERYETYGNLQINQSAGVPDITVPIYKIQLRDFVWNINLAYNAKGNRVEDVASSVGLGWNLNVNGIISATVFDKPDILFPHENEPYVLKRDLELGGAIHNFSCHYSNNYDVFTIAEGAINGYRNFSPDIFSINVGNVNTKMFLLSDTGYTMPASNNKVILIRDGQGKGVQFRIVDGEGNKYYLSNKGYNKRLLICPGKDKNPDPNPVFYLDSIRTFSGEKITFNYLSEEVIYTYFYTRKEVFAEKEISNGGNTDPCNALFDVSRYNVICENRFVSHEPLLSSIEVSNGILIQLSYESRLDVGGKRLKELSITSNGTLISRYAFDNNQYFGIVSNPATLRLKLSSLLRFGGDGSLSGTHNFVYDTTNLPPRQSLNVDWYGFFNHADNQSLIPQHPLGSNRESNLSGSKACVLKKIIYPAGGSTSFDYDLSGLPGGGLRIKSIKDNDGISDTRERYFSYGPSGWTGCISNDEPSTHWFWLDGFNGGGGVVLASCSFTKYHSSSFCLPYAFINKPDPFFARVEELFGNNGIEGKIVSFFDWKASYVGHINAPIELSKRQIFKKVGSSFVLVKQEDFEYVKVISDDQGIYDDVSGIKEKRIWGKDIEMVRQEMVFTDWQWAQCAPKLFRQEPIRFASVPHHLVSHEVSTFDEHGSNPMKTKETYYYDNEWHGLATRVERTGSMGEVFLTIKNYPGDYDQTGFVSDLIQKNVVEKVLEEVTVNLTSPGLIVSGAAQIYTSQGWISKVYALDNSGAAETLKLPNFRFSNLSTPGVLPHNTSERKPFALNIERYSLKYDIAIHGLKGEPKWVRPNSGISHSYKWDRLSQYPIAECINAQPGEFFYEDFEGNGILVGNSTDSWAGSGSFLGSINLVNHFSPSMNNRSFMLSYFTKDNGVWRYVLVPYTGQTLSGLVDEVRIFPTDSQITTFTYQRNVGLTSITGTDGLTVFYGYDSFGRLHWVKDHNGHFLQVHNYHSITSN